MTTDVLHDRSLEPAAPAVSLPLAVRLAFRELRRGVSGFGIFIACIALGVAVIAGVGALGDALRSSFERQGATLLGGDVTVQRPHKRADTAERTWLDAQGRVGEIVTVRAMARRTDLSDQLFVEVKGIDDAYPLVGEVRLSHGLRPADLLRSSDVAVDPIVLARLGLSIGDTITLGTTQHVIRATVEAEPDKIGDRLTGGPRVLIATSTLEKTTLIDPGALANWRYAVLLDDPARTEPGALTRFSDRLKTGLPEAGFTVRDRRDPSPSVTRTLERLRQFLTLLGLTALLVGGVGVANAVDTYIDRRRGVIATMKSLGATTGTIFAVHLVQVMALAGIGVAIGLVVGAQLPALVVRLAGDALPVAADLGIRAGSLATAALYGFLVALLFTLWPLGRAEQVRATALFRDEVAPSAVWPRRAILVAMAITAAVLFGLAIFGSDARLIAAYFCAAVVGILVLFTVLGRAITWIAARIPRPRHPAVAIARGNIAAPGSLATSVVLSLGAGLSLLVAVALVDRSIVGELTNRIPEVSPNYFVLDIKRGELDDFSALVRKNHPAAEIHTAPMLRGRIVRVGDRPTEQLRLRPEHQWVLNGDRGLSYAVSVPDGSKVVDGAWWPADYRGEPLVSFEADLAKALGLKIGDTVTVNVLGRNVTARVANTREVKWESLALNFVMVFDPNTLRGAPHNVLGTVTLGKGATVAEEAAVAREIGRAFPATTAIRVKDAIDQFSAIFERIMTAVRGAGSITILAGTLVLAGALATAQRRRIKQAVILKALGATRSKILSAHAVEYGVLAAITAAIAVLLGSLTAYATLKAVMDLEFVFSLAAVLQALGVALALVFLFGGYGTWRVLQARPVPHLRSE
jgi:putative ABC transport system permease protein